MTDTPRTTALAELHTFFLSLFSSLFLFFLVAVGRAKHAEAEVACPGAAGGRPLFLRVPPSTLHTPFRVTGSVPSFPLAENFLAWLRMPEVFCNIRGISDKINCGRLSKTSNNEN